MITNVAVIVPTLRRPDSLERALRSLFAQVRVADRLCEIVVADNDPEGSARDRVESLRAHSPWRLVYIHVPTPGVATARNAALAATDASLIAFLDDDEAAAPDWLARILAAHEASGADVTFSPIHGRAEGAPGWLKPYLERFFGREGPAKSGLIDHAYGCGASLMTRATALPGAAPFDVSADQSGGEDDALFAGLAARGGRFGWAADAWVEEFAPPHRATLRYALTRAFAYGQGPSQTAAKEKNWPALARWMIVGAAQAAVFGAAALVMTLIGHSRRAFWMDRAVRGLGKLAWMPGLEPQFYGASELKRLNRA